MQPFSAGVVIGTALSDATESFRTTVSVAAWIAWLVILLAIGVPRPDTLTIARVGTAGGLIGTLWAAWDVDANHTDAGAATLAIGLVASIAAVATVTLPGVADRFLDGVSYGDERRFALRAPGPVLVVALIPSVLIVIVGLTAGPLLLAGERWVGGAIVTVVGFGVSWFPLNALHRLTNRFLVFVPNGLVVHDPTQIAGTRPVRAARDRRPCACSARHDRQGHHGGRPGPRPRTSIRDSDRAVVRQRAHHDRQRDRALRAHRPDSPHCRHGHGARARITIA